MNQMPSLIGEVRKSVDDYSSELFSLKSKALNIGKSGGSDSCGGIVEYVKLKKGKL